MGQLYFDKESIHEINQNPMLNFERTHARTHEQAQSNMPFIFFLKVGGMKRQND